MAGGPRQVQDQRPLLLLERPVDHADRHLEPAALDRLEQRPQVDGRGQWGKPDLVGRLSGAAQAGDQDLQVGGDEGGVEQRGWGGVDLEEGAPWGRRQVVGIGDPEDGGGLGGAEGPEADPEAEVAVEAAQAALVEALGGQQQVHAEAAPHPADGAEQVEELGTGGQELAELVDDDQQVRQRFQPWVGGAPGGVGP